MKKVNFENVIGFRQSVVNQKKSLHIGGYMDCPDGDVEVFEAGRDLMVMCNGRGVGVFRDVWQLDELVAVAQTYNEAGYPENHRLFGSGSAGWSDVRRVIAEAMPVKIRVTDRIIARVRDLRMEDVRDLGCNVANDGSVEVRGARGNIFFPWDGDTKSRALKLIFKTEGWKYDDNAVLLLYRFNIERDQL